MGGLKKRLRDLEPKVRHLRISLRWVPGGKERNEILKKEKKPSITKKREKEMFGISNF